MDLPTQQDLSLATTLAHLCTFLTRNLGKHYTPQTIARLHDRIRHHLTPRLSPTWDPLNPSSGCGTRSLIAMPGRFPTPLVNAAIEVGVDPVVWAREMSESGEWQLWVDPGSICWRDGGWTWVEEGYERERMYKREFGGIRRAFTFRWSAQRGSRLEESENQGMQGILGLTKTKPGSYGNHGRKGCL